jgi:hypothetical protein
MKTPLKQGHRRFQLKVLPYCDSYYLERIAQLESALARKPRRLQIDMIGNGEIPADPALLIRSVLMSRSPRTHLITAARSSLQGGAVMVWLLGDSRIIRDDAKLYFRRANLAENQEAKPDEVWKTEEPNPWVSSSEIDPGEGDYARVLEVINEFLPVHELTGRLIGVPVLRQFGLVENERVDDFLATAFARQREPAGSPLRRPETKRPRKDAKSAPSRPVRK